MQPLLVFFLQVSGGTYQAKVVVAGQYQDIFRQGNLSKSDLEPYCLRLVAFVELTSQDRYSIEFTQSHAARYVSVMFTERIFVEELHDPQFGKNYDCQTIYFSGHKIPSLFNNTHE